MTEGTNERFKQLAIRVEQETKDRFNDLAKLAGFNQTEFLIHLMDSYENMKIAAKEEGEKNEHNEPSNPEESRSQDVEVKDLSDRQIIEHILSTVDASYQAFLKEPLKQHLDERIDEITRITQTSAKAEEVLTRISEAKSNVMEIANRSESAYKEIESSVKSEVASIKMNYEKLLNMTAEKCKESIRETTKHHYETNRKINGHLGELEKTVIKASGVADNFEKMCREQTRNLAESSLNYDAKIREISDGMINRVKWTITLNKVLCATAIVALLAGVGNIFYTVSEGAKVQEAKASYSSCMTYVQGLQNQACIMKDSDPQMRSLKEKLNCPSS